MKRRIGMRFRGSGISVYRAAAVCDATGINHRPGAVAVRNGRVVAVGDDQDVMQQVRAVEVIDLPDMLILPAMVNAHAHLNLTPLGPRPYNGRFIDWLKMVIAEAPRDDAAVADAVRQGVEGCWAAGVGTAGDIAPSPAAIQARMETGLQGVSYLECFGLGKRQQQTIDELNDLFEGHPALDRSHPTVALGIEPHAPYSAGPELYHAATKYASSHAYRLSTHMAETPEELAFVRDGTGPFVDLLKELGKWEPGLAPARGEHPIDWLDDVLKHGRWLLAHCNYVDDAHIEKLAKYGVSVAYCPVASDYFGHTGHRYRDMLEAGVNVCLGTDSVICQPPHEPQPLGILPQMRWLYRRDGTDPQTLLRMATINGTRALSMISSNATLRAGTHASMIAVAFNPDDPTDPLTQILENDAPAEPLMYIA